MARLSFRRLKPGDIFKIDLQPSQRFQVGIPMGDMTLELAQALAEQPVAWTAKAGRLLACFGIAEQFEGRQGLGWAMLADGLGKHLLPITRFIRYEIFHAGLARFELIAKCADLEPAIAWSEAQRGEPLDAGELVALALLYPTAPMRWAAALGMRPAHVLRCFGAMSESHLLYERISPPAALMIERAA